MSINNHAVIQSYPYKLSMHRQIPCAWRLKGGNDQFQISGLHESTTTPSGKTTDTYMYNKQNPMSTIGPNPKNINHQESIKNVKQII